MLSELQRQKIDHLFKVLDSNKNGILQPDDFTLVANKMSDLLKLTEDSTKRLELQVLSFRLFIQLLTDMQKDEISITKREWNRLFDTLMFSDERILKSYVTRITSYVFILFDQNHDRSVSIKEYSDMFRCYNIPQDSMVEAFRKLDTNGNGLLSRSEIIDGFYEFFLSSNKDSPGNWIFGDWTKQ